MTIKNGDLEFNITTDEIDRMTAIISSDGASSNNKQVELYKKTLSLVEDNIDGLFNDMRLNTYLLIKKDILNESKKCIGCGSEATCIYPIEPTTNPYTLENKNNLAPLCMYCKNKRHKDLTGVSFKK